MAFGSFDQGHGPQPMAEINTTPLVDVMLVLLVIFIITAPLFHQAVPVDLPKVESRKLDDKPLVLQVAIDAQGHVFINGEVSDSSGLHARFAQAVAGPQIPELQLRADRNTRYEQVTAVLADAQKAGIARIAFVTEPAR
ncbi:MAG: hypothetical protein RIR00_1806 [Pseudomonadota bacterium]|jgi:biopolymer transport protein ExbD